MKDIKIGVEIEAVYNDNLLPSFEVGGYHEGISFLNKWVAERDGSLCDENEFKEWSKTAEFIGGVFQNESDFFKGLETFERFFSQNGKFELNEVLSFNKSCGSHIHFSIKGFKFGKKVVFEIYPKVRNYFFKLLDNSNIESKEEIKAHYFRDYARKLNELNFIERRMEFNFRSEFVDKGIEWRSPNLLNIQYWDEFFEYWKIVYNSLKYFYKIAQRYDIKHKEEKILSNSEEVVRLKKEIESNLIEKEENINFKLKKKKKRYSRFLIDIGGQKNVQFEYID